MSEELPNEAAKAPDEGGYSNFTVDTIQSTMDKFLSTANVNAVYAAPVREGNTTIITCAEVVSALGFGVGEGGGQDKEGSKGMGSGGGGGGRTFARPVAAIIATPEGVTIKPIVDTTKIGIAVLTTLGFMFGMMGRMRRSRSR